eukprot:Skav204500  [mRNA]  locus=scaffold527:29851:31497:+ [translate_table: standard]
MIDRLQHSWLLLALGLGKKYCKKVSAKRLLVNNVCAENHKIWNSYGLKLADCDGAVKKCFIDLDTPKAFVKSDLGKIFHAPENLEDAKQLMNLSSMSTANTCVSRNGICSSGPFAALAAKCATCFARDTSKFNLQAGTLVKIMPAGLPGLNPVASVYFLGACCKKPVTQVLVKAIENPDDNKLYGLLPESERFTLGFATTHQVFQTLLLQYCQDCEPAQVEQVDFLVEAFTCSFPDHFSNVQKLEVHAFHTATTRFKICCGKRSTHRQPKACSAKLPFGLQHASKPFKRKKTHGGRTDQKKKKTEPKPPSNENSDSADCALDESCSDSEQEEDDPQDRSEGTSKKDSGSDSDSAASHASSLSESSSSSDTSGSSDAGGPGDLALSETLMPPTAVALAEENVVEEEKKKAFLDAQASQVEASAVSEAEPVPVPTPKPKPMPRGTYFATSVRFDGGSIAPSSRSVCFHCNGKIEQHSVRFTYFYNPRKPSRYIHQRCVAPFAMADLTGACKDQAVRGMMDIIANNPDSDGVSPVKLAAEQVLAQILSDPR